MLAPSYFITLIFVVFLQLDWAYKLWYDDYVGALKGRYNWFVEEKR